MTPNHELIEQLALAGDSLVRAVVQLRPATGATRGGDFGVLARRVLDRVAETVGHAAKRTNILQNAESIILEADPTFLREMIKQPEIVSALPSQTKERMSIPPVRKRPLKRGDI
ncbi:MAG: hypothetical protein WKF77_12815 [Planctomycetaceae bacterium]